MGCAWTGGGGGAPPFIAGPADAGSRGTLITLGRWPFVSLTLLSP